jgi:predicted RNA-binding protein associated with RNAse of E/G family
LTRSDPVRIRFQFKRYNNSDENIEGDLVAQLPGLLISQFAVPDGGGPDPSADTTALRFDFFEDWYSIVAFLNGNKLPTGRYQIAMQSPLHSEDGAWRGVSLILGVEVYPDWEYFITNEEEFLRSVEEGWMRVYSAAKARECLRRLCAMLDEHCLPPEVMDAVGG